MKTVIGLFEQYTDADFVVSELQRRGIRRDQLNVLAREETVRDRLLAGAQMTHDPVADGIGAGATGGALAGGLVGLLAGISAAAVPGVGPVYAAGALWSALFSTAAGASLGAVGGSLIGAIMGWGLPEEEAHLYAEGVQRGAILVAAHVPDEAVPQVESLMNDGNAVDIEAYRDQLRQSGWERFDATRTTAPETTMTTASRS